MFDGFETLLANKKCKRKKSTKKPKITVLRLLELPNDSFEASGGTGRWFWGFRRYRAKKYKASNCSSGLLNFCLLCSNLRQFHPLNGSTFTHSLSLKISDHRFTIKWKSALEQIVKFFWNLLSRKLLYFSFLCTCCLMYHYSNGVSAIGRWK